jgi:hypothetical protein
LLPTYLKLVFASLAEHAIAGINLDGNDDELSGYGLAYGFDPRHSMAPLNQLLKCGFTVWALGPSFAFVVGRVEITLKVTRSQRVAFARSDAAQIFHQLD